MKPIIIFGLFILVMVLAQFAQAQTVDEIIDKNTAAMGGKEKLATLNSVRKEGSMNAQGADVSIVITTLHTVGDRTDFSVMGTQNYQIVTATNGSVFMPIFGQSSPEPMGEQMLKAGQNNLDLKGIFINYKEKGIQAEYIGKQMVDANECYHLKATFKNGNVTNYFIDTKTDRLYKTTTKGKMNGEELEIFINFSNYKQNADGYWFAYTTTNERGDINYDKIETNIKVDESIFKD